MGEQVRCNSRELCVSGDSLRTRSQVAPDWTVQESIILVNEISAVEGDCLNTLSSFQKWKIIVENCNVLEVNRGLNQCRRKWDSLLAEYKRIKQWESKVRSLDDGDRRKQLGLPENFDTDLFKAIDDHVKAREGRCDTDPDSDPEAEADLSLNVIAQSGSKKQRRRVMPQKHSIEESIKPRRRCKIEKIKAERSSLEEKGEYPKHSIDEKMMPEESNQDKKEKIVGAKLHKNAGLINGILEGNLDEDVDYRLADLKNDEAIQNDFMRRQGSKKQRRRLMPQKRRIEERVKPRRRCKSEKIKAELRSSEEKGEHPTHILDERMIPEESSQEEKEQMMAAKLFKNAELINGILEGNLADNVDYRSADLNNVEAIQTDFTRFKGDKIISCLGNIADTLDQLCNLLQERG